MRESIKKKSRIEIKYVQTNFNDEMNRNFLISSGLSVGTLLLANLLISGDWGQQLIHIRLIWIAVLCWGFWSLTRMLFCPKMLLIWTESCGIAMDIENGNIFARLNLDDEKFLEIPVFKNNLFKYYAESEGNYVCEGVPSKEMIAVLHIIARNENIIERIYKVNTVKLCIAL